MQRIEDVRLQKILCPVDFSPGSKQALDVAARLARSTNAELVVAHAWFVPPLPTEAEYPLPPAIVDKLLADEQIALAAAAQQAAALGARVTTSFLTGPPWDRIVSLLRDDPRFDLVVLGTHGRTGLQRILLGSVAEKIVRHAPCPVLVTRGGHAPPYQHALCPIDFSESSKRAVMLASQFVAPAGSLTLLYVIELPVSFDGQASMSEFLRDLDARSTRMLDRFAAEVRGRVEVDVKTQIRVGSAGSQALAALDHGGYDLVAVGSHGRTGLRRALLGSVAEKIVRHAPCSVLVARTRD